MHWNVVPDALPGSATYVRILDRWLNDCTEYFTSIWIVHYSQLRQVVSQQSLHSNKLMQYRHTRTSTTAYLNIHTSALYAYQYYQYAVLAIPAQSCIVCAHQSAESASDSSWQTVMDLKHWYNIGYLDASPTWPHSNASHTTPRPPLPHKTRTRDATTCCTPILRTSCSVKQRIPPGKTYT